MKRTMTLLPLILCAALAQFVIAQHSPSANQAEQRRAGLKREGAITGRIIGDDGQGVAGVEVFANRIGENRGSRPSTTSDDEGNFKLTGLSPGVYALFARIPGFVTSEAAGESGIHRIGEFVTLSLVKGGVITGRVTDELGEPMVGVRVRPHRLRDLEGGMPRSPEMSGAGGGLTDDRGIYRLYGLAPGVYVVSLGAGPEYGPAVTQISRDAPTYYPSATRETAAEISLRSGEEAPGVDIRHRAERGRTVSGVVESSQSFNYVSITLKSFETGQFEAAATIRNSRGFAIYGVQDGEYELSAASAIDSDETFGSTPRRISVRGADVSGIELKLLKHGSIAGRVVIESSNPATRCASDTGGSGNQATDQGQAPTKRQPVIEEIMLKADREETDQRAPRPWSGRFEYWRGSVPGEKGEFILRNLEPGRYRIAANLPDDGWFVRAITQPGAGSAKPAAGAAKNSIDAAPSGVTFKPGEKLSGVEVIVAEGAASLDGRLVPAKEGMKLPSRLRAHLIPAEATAANDALRYAEAIVRSDGSFEFKHIAPGKYLLHARQVAEKEAGDDQVRPAAWDAGERTKLRREAEAAKNEVELQPCQRVKDHVLRFNR